MNEPPVNNTESAGWRNVDMDNNSEPIPQVVEDTTSPPDRKKRLSESQKDEMVNFYQQGLTANEIAKKFDVSTSTVTSHLKKRGISIRDAVTPAPILAQAAELYKGGMTAEQVGEKLGISSNAVFTALRHHGIEKRPYIRQRHHAVNESFFETIDTEEKAYWTGFLTADGHVGDRFIDVHLAIRDEDHIHKFATSLDYKGPIEHKTVGDKNGNKFPCVGIRVHSKKIVEHLHALGFGEKKTFTITVPEKIPEKLLQHYWRGVFDGDGSISYRKDATWEMNLVGNQSILTSFQQFISQRSHTNAQVHPFSTTNIFRISFCGIHVVKEVIRILYGEASIFLTRKKELAYQALAESEENHQGPRIHLPIPIAGKEVLTSSPLNPAITFSEEKK